jgi:RNA binding exosome subunit
MNPSECLECGGEAIATPGRCTDCKPEEQLELETAYYRTEDLERVIAHLRRNKSYDAMGLYYEGPYEGNDGRLYRTPTIEEQGEQIKLFLHSLIRTVDEIVQHQCRHKTDDTDSFYLRCPVCGSDGNS